MGRTDEHIGQAVASLRHPRTQQSVADAMRDRGHKWSQATMWSIEKGERPLRLTEALDLAEVLDATVDDLLSSEAAQDERTKRRMIERGQMLRRELHVGLAAFLEIQAHLSRRDDGSESPELRRILDTTPESILEQAREQAREDLVRLEVEGESHNG